MEMLRPGHRPYKGWAVPAEAVAGFTTPASSSSMSVLCVVISAVEAQVAACPTGAAQAHPEGQAAPAVVAAGFTTVGSSSWIGASFRTTAREMAAMEGTAPAAAEPAAGAVSAVRSTAPEQLCSMAVR